MPEQECCLAYRPSNPRASPPRAAGLYALNLSSWLVLTLCDGRPEPAIAEEFIAAMPAGSEHGASRAALVGALAQLRTFGLVSRTTGAGQTDAGQIDGAQSGAGQSGAGTFDARTLEEKLP